MKHKPIEIFCGTGGVGKTTLATSRALYLAQKGCRVLLITIDPAKRLKQVLNLDDSKAGEINSISSKIFLNEGEEFHFDALLMSPSHTLKRMAERNNSFQDFDNHIVKILTRPYGGMNEIMAIIEVQYQLQTKKYDSIVLDTPPGKHFIDFLESNQKIQNFFNKNFVEIFKYLGKSFSKNDSDKSGMLSFLVKSGIKKLLGYLEKVTGKTFLDEFIDAVAGLYRNKDSFLAALSFQEDLKKEDFSNWFLVTSANQQKMSEATDMQLQVKDFVHQDSYMAINKCLRTYLENWQLSDNSPLISMKATMLERENKIKEVAKSDYKEILEFPEVLEAQPAQHVLKLAQIWQD